MTDRNRGTLINEADLSGPVIDRDTASALMAPLTDLVLRAGAAILAVNRDAMKVDGKQDGSPVTEADLAADRIIGEGLMRLVPDIPAVSEERECTGSPFRGSFFLIDPLDGTKEYVAGRNEFTVNLALVNNGTPLLGIIGAPALGLIWRGLVGQGAQRLTTSGSSAGAATSIHTRRLPQPGQPWVAAVSRSHGDARTEAFIDARPGASRSQLGSAVKFGRVAEGAVDIYPRLAPTSEWDIAAGHAIVTAAGGKVGDTQGNPIKFGQGTRDFIVPEFVAWGDPAAAG
jgi:3'(2'), 5'-bisphosphate nucleotidase